MRQTTVDNHGIEANVYERRWIILGVLCLSLVLVVAAVSSINVAIPSIRAQLHPTDTQLLWIVDIYAVVFAGLLLPAGALGDKFGRKGALQCGLTIFGIAAVLSSQAGSPNVLLIFRFVMGIGAALIMPSTLSLLTSVFPPHERPKAIAVWAGFAGAGGVIGTLLGGFVLTHFWFGSVFFVSVLIAFVALVMVTIVCPSSKEMHEVPLDPLGALLSMVGFGSLLYGIIEGPEKGWGTIHSIGAFALCVVAFVGFVAWERRTAHPMLNIRFFSIGRFRAGSIGVTFTFFTMFALFFVISQYLQSVRDYSPLRAGFAVLPFAVTSVVVSPRGATLSARFEPRRVVLTGLCIVPIGILLLSFVGQSTPYVFIAASLVIMATGSSLALPTLSTGIVLSLPMDKAGVGSAVNDTTREVGGAVGIAVIGSILAAQYRSGIAAQLAGVQPQVAAIARDGVSALSAFAQSAPTTSGLPQLLAVARSSFVDGMQIGLRVSAAIALAVAIVVWRSYPAGHLRPMGAEAHLRFTHTVRRLQPTEHELLRSMRLRSLSLEPTAFGSTFEREVAFSDDDWRGRLHPGASPTFVACDDSGEAVGSVVGATDLGDTQIALLLAMWVEPQARGTGAADELIGAVIRWAAAEHHVAIQLLVAEGNSRAERVYERNGFARTGRSQVRDRDGVAEIEMERRLEQNEI